MSAIIRHLAETKKNLHRKAASRAARMNAGDAYSDAINAAIGGSSGDAQTLAGAAAGAGAGFAVGGVWGAIAGFIGGAVANAGANAPAWLDPAQIGNFAYATIVVGADRQLPPWDIGAGLVNLPGTPPTYNNQATINQEATNLIFEMLMSRRDLLTIGPTGDMAPEVEQACFLFAQITLAWSSSDLLQGFQAFMSAPTWDMGTAGNDLKQLIRWQMQQIIQMIWAQPQSKLASQGGTVAAAQQRVGMATFQIPHLAVGAAAASRAAIASATVRVRPSLSTTRQATAATRSLAVPLAIGAALAVVAAVAL
jgi:hypothetical protein